MNESVDAARLRAQPDDAALSDAAASSGAQVGVPRPHESAHLHVAGEAPYTDDLPEVVGMLHVALGLSPVAHGRLTDLELERIRALPGVVAVLTGADFPGPNDCGAIVHDEPILATIAFRDDGSCAGELRYAGQPVFAVVADTRDAARRAAAQAADAMTVEALPAVLTMHEAHARGEYVLPPMHLNRSVSGAGAKAAIDAAPHRLHGTFELGGQEHFYLEGQVSCALPTEDDGLLVLCSTQHPSEMQHVVATSLGLSSHRVRIECRRMGGGFGGKESQSAAFACIAALAARRLKRPVKLRLDRDDDICITGGRHGFHIDYAVGHDDAGRVLGAELTLLSNAGHSADLSGPVMSRALCHVDNAYWLPEVALHGYSCRTNTRSNTAFRGFGGPQGAIAIEQVLDSIARRLGLDPLDVRRANFYGVGERDSAPYGQAIAGNLLHPLTEQLVGSSEYRDRRADVAQFNAHSPVLKRGIALTPVKFGIAFNVSHLNQAGALVHVYTDGSVLVNHGGTEMGQGLNTKVAQVVAHELGIAFERVRVTATDTHKVANTSATAASTGSDLNGKAAQHAARQIRDRLAAFAVGRHGGDAMQVRFADDAVQVGTVTLRFTELVMQAYAGRVQLWSDGHYATPGLHWDRETMQGHPFQYFACGAAVSEVVVDTLTGEWKLLRADLLHDVGTSLNPAIDLGQIEGGFIQGMGWLTTEELVWHPADGSARAGRLLTHAPSTYKIPTANDGPPVFNVALYNEPTAADTIHRSKAVGEPPLLLSFSVFFAIRDAISAASGHRVDPPLTAPATPEAILRAINAVQANGDAP